MTIKSFVWCLAEDCILVATFHAAISTMECSSIEFVISSGKMDLFILQETNNPFPPPPTQTSKTSSEASAI